MNTITKLEECQSIDDVINLINNASDDNFIYDTQTAECIASTYALDAAKASIDDSTDSTKMNAEIEAQLDYLYSLTDKFNYAEALELAINNRART